MKIVTVIGARPQFIKAAALSRELNKHKGMKEIIIHTGQHFDHNMSELFFEQMEIPRPNYNLNINGMSHGAMTGQMLEEIEGIIANEKPDWVLVYGDTNSTIAGALAAKKLHIKVAHVEAGLRSFNMDMPEEINRILTDRISDVLFCPTNKAVENLKNEGFENIDCKIAKCGDVMQDAALFYYDKARKPDVMLPGEFILATCHRAENTDDELRLKEIFKSLENISLKEKVVLPLHPRTKGRLLSMNYDFDNTAILFIEPIGYLEMIYLLKNCRMVMTDSGGLQKEAFFFKKPCVTLREETEWVELVDNKFNILAGSSEERIQLAYSTMNNIELCFEQDLYGNGKACSKIVEQLLLT